MIPIDSEKRPVLRKGEVKGKRDKISTFEELAFYFVDKNGKTRTAGIGLLINETEFTIDTDGCGESVFQNRVYYKLSPTLQTKVNSTMCTKTPHGYHRIFRYKVCQ